MQIQTALSEPLDLRVVYLNGTTTDYRTAPVDVYRTEMHFGQSLAAMNGSWSALAHMAYSVALRRGDAYRAKKPGTNKADLFEAWLETIDNVFILTDEEPAHDNGTEPSGDADPKEPPTLADSPRSF